MPIRDVDGFGPRRHAELPVDIREVELHRLLGEPEPLRDLLVRESLAEQAQDRQLPLAQPGLRGRRRLALIRFAKGLVGNRSLHRLTESGRQITRIDVLSDERLRAPIECRADDVRRVHSGENDGRDSRMPPLEQFETG